MKLDLSGHRALICGASKGIGKEIARAFAEAGAELLLLARNEQSLSELRAELPSPPSHQILAFDMSHTGELEKQIQDLASSKAFTILVNNAGGPPAGPLVEASLENFEQAFRLHILSAQILTKCLLPGMKERKYGRIINIISTSVKVPLPNLGVSNTIRGAMASWSKTMANELGPWGITVNNILPGYTSTERLQGLKEGAAKRMGVSVEEIEKQWLSTIPARRFANPEETAAAALFLASPLASYINGVNLPVDGGRTGCL